MFFNRWEGYIISYISRLTEPGTGTMSRAWQFWWRHPPLGVSQLQHRCVKMDHSTSLSLSRFYRFACTLQWHYKPDPKLSSSLKMWILYTILTLCLHKLIQVEPANTGHCEQISLDEVQICYVTVNRFRWTSINLAPTGKFALLSLPL